MCSWKLTAHLSRESAGSDERDTHKRTRGNARNKMETALNNYFTHKDRIHRLFSLLTEKKNSDISRCCLPEIQNSLMCTVQFHHHRNDPWKSLSFAAWSIQSTRIEASLVYDHGCCVICHTYILQGTNFCYFPEQRFLVLENKANKPHKQEISAPCKVVPIWSRTALAVPSFCQDRHAHPESFTLQASLIQRSSKERTMHVPWRLAL